MSEKYFKVSDLRLICCDSYDYDVQYYTAEEIAKTIKAIPIEWIENWVDILRERNYHNYTVLMPALIEMLENWEKENGTEESNRNI